jgi:hypothetical protein
MNAPWKNFISPWWPSATDAGVRFPVPPTPAVDELRRESWPTIVAQTTSRLPQNISEPETNDPGSCACSPESNDYPHVQAPRPRILLHAD